MFPANSAMFAGLLMGVALVYAICGEHEKARGWVWAAMGWWGLVQFAMAFERMIT